MARLRRHETLGTSVNCKTLTPFPEGEGPTFTIHIFDTQQLSEAGNKICAFEIWQRDADKKRTLVASGEGLEFADPTSDEAMLQITQAIAAQDQSHDFHIYYARVLNDEAAVRFTPRVKRHRKPRIAATAVPTIVESTQVEVVANAPAENALTLVEAPHMEITMEPASASDPAPRIHVHMDLTFSTSPSQFPAQAHA